MLVFGTQGGPSATTATVPWVLVRERLKELGHVEGRTIAIEEHFAEGNPERLAQLARAIVDSKPDVILALAAVATLAARRATDTIPIVMAHAGDPVGGGLAQSLSHPGGNVTGTTSMVPELAAKQLEIQRQLIPRLSTLGVLMNPTNPGHVAQLANMRAAAHALGIGIAAAEVTRAEEFDAALNRIRDSRPNALFVMIDPMVFMSGPKLLEFARTHRLPASFDVGRDLVRDGGLVSYGPVLSTHYALVAEYVDKILKGARPADLPIQQPTQFSLSINLKAARELGVTVPQSLLLRADEVFE